MSTPTARHDPYAALRFASFRHLVAGTFLLTCGLQMQRVALGYTLYLITRDPLSLGLLGLAEAVPRVLRREPGAMSLGRASGRESVLWDGGCLGGARPCKQIRHPRFTL